MKSMCAGLCVCFSTNIHSNSVCVCLSVRVSPHLCVVCLSPIHTFPNCLGKARSSGTLSSMYWFTVLLKVDQGQRWVYKIELGKLVLTKKKGIPQKIIEPCEKHKAVPSSQTKDSLNIQR